MYSFGIIMWEILTRKTPYEDSTDIPKGRFKVIEYVTSGGRPVVPPDVPPWYKDLMTKCWASDPSERPSFHEILEGIEAQIVAHGGDGAGTLQLQTSISMKEMHQDAKSGILSSIKGLAAMFGDPKAGDAGIPLLPRTSQ